MIPTNMGFVISYVVLFKSFAPFSLELAGVDLPGWCDSSQTGQIFWAVIFTVSVPSLKCLVSPMLDSLVRNNPSNDSQTALLIEICKCILSPT